MMQCKGYGKQTPHEAEQIHARGMCEKCYHRWYFEQNKTAIVKYQKSYQREYRKK
jgi:hypothetical protein